LTYNNELFHTHVMHPHMHLHTHTHTCIYTQTYTHPHTHMHIHTRAPTHAHTHTHAPTHEHTYYATGTLQVLRERGNQIPFAHPPVADFTVIDTPRVNAVAELGWRDFEQEPSHKPRDL